ncbi:hypothetical protein TNCV_1176301 [Trichonephila clavipes]|nr:hypothetical protein TNCV_1176301 [Trichonephila clavipes]
MHSTRDSFIQDGCCFGLLALDNRRNNSPHKHLGRPKRIGYNCPRFGSLQVPISNKNYIPFSRMAALRLHYLNILESSKIEVTVAGSIAFLIMTASLQRST